MFIVGVTLVKGYESEQDVRLDVGQTTEVGGYAFKFLGVVPGPGPNYRALTGTVEVRKDGRLIETLTPEKRIYNASGQTMPSPRSISVPRRSLRVAGRAAGGR